MSTAQGMDDGGTPAAARRAPWAAAPRDVADALEVDPLQGLSRTTARERRRRHGPNRLAEAAARPLWRIALEQFRSVVVLILAVAGALAFVFGSLPEGFAILAVLAINGGIGFASEWRATRSMEALRKLGQPKARVRRAGRDRTVSVAALVPGDVVILEAGDVPPADLRLIEAHGVTADESALTGESVAVPKRSEAVAADAPLAGRTSMLFKGTTITQGSAVGLAVGTGMATELGRISQLAEEVGEDATPLERGLGRLGRRMAVLVLAAAALIAVAGIWTGRPLELTIATAVALGVAAVPEGLPIVANLALARGMWRMARRNALINRLPAVETLGATDVIFTDKTGTLTENRMTLARVVTPAGQTALAAGDRDRRPEPGGAGEAAGAEDTAQENPLLKRALEIGVLCSNAALPDEADDAQDTDADGQGDPTEVALLRAGRDAGLRRAALLEDKPETREESFDPGRNTQGRSRPQEA